MADPNEPPKLPEPIAALVDDLRLISDEGRDALGVALRARLGEAPRSRSSEPRLDPASPRDSG